MTDTAETLRRWRLVLGGGAADGTGCSLGAQDARIDDTLSALYDAERTGGLGGSSPNVARWLGDIREFFPSRVVQVMQQDAIERLALKRLMLEPEVLESLAPDVNLVATLLSLKNLIPSKTKATARIVVRRVVEQLERQLATNVKATVFANQAVYPHLRARGARVVGELLEPVAQAHAVPAVLEREVAVRLLDVVGRTLARLRRRHAVRVRGAAGKAASSGATTSATTTSRPNTACRSSPWCCRPARIP